VVNYHAGYSFAPASNLKLLYTLAAIDKLGKDYRYETRLMYHRQKSSTGFIRRFGFSKLPGDPSFGFYPD